MQHGPPKRLYLPVDMASHSVILNSLQRFALVWSCDSIQFWLYLSWAKQEEEEEEDEEK